jgi:signal transduction histidine kinase
MRQRREKRISGIDVSPDRFQDARAEGRGTPGRSKTQGLGLGLPTCRTIVSAHGGRLWATNNPQRGATLHVELPGTD